jgi:predicted PurR-regulated permease PerM
MGRDSTSRTLITLAILGVLAWAVWLVWDVLPPFLMALALALVLDPLHGRMQRWGVRRGVAVFVTVFVFLLIFVGVVAFLGPKATAQVRQFLENADEYGRRLQETADAWVRSQSGLLTKLRLPANLGALAGQLRDQLGGAAQGALQGLPATLQASAATLGWLVIVPIVTLYLLLDMDRIRVRFFHVLPDQHRETVGELCGKVGGVFAAYLRGLILICLSYGLVVYVILGLWLQLPYALVLALVGGFLYAVPYLGQFTLWGVCAGVAAATGHNAAYVGVMVAALLGAGQLFDQLITPRVIGGQVGLHPVLGLFALMVGGKLFGLMGMVLAIPVAASVRVILGEVYPRLTEPIPGSEPVPQREVPEAVETAAPAAPALPAE